MVVETFEPELAILEVGLPDLSGYELLGALRARLGPRAPYFAALTGWPEAHAKALAVGFDHCLVKPATRAQLCAEVVELAERKAPPGLGSFVAASARRREHGPGFRREELAVTNEWGAFDRPANLCLTGRGRC